MASRFGSFLSVKDVTDVLEAMQRLLHMSPMSKEFISEEHTMQESYSDPPLRDPRLSGENSVIAAHIYNSFGGAAIYNHPKLCDRILPHSEI